MFCFSAVKLLQETSIYIVTVLPINTINIIYLCVRNYGTGAHCRSSDPTAGAERSQETPDATPLRVLAAVTERLQEVIRLQATKLQYLNMAFEMENLFFTKYAKILATPLNSNEILNAHSELPSNRTTNTT